MESLRELYRIGRGPSSSHTMGPGFAAERFRAAFPQADSFEAVLYGSLAKTGRGHLTDVALKEAFAPVPASVLFNTEETALKHPNTLRLTAFRAGEALGSWKVHSVGGGKIEIEGHPEGDPEDVYPLSSFDDIRAHCEREGLRLWQYAEACEGEALWAHLEQVWAAMQRAIRHGLAAEGTLQGGLGVQRKASLLYRQHPPSEAPETRENRLVCAYAFAVSEENAGGGVIVTAPTCGASGVVPAVMRYHQERYGFSDKEIVRALATAGVVGDLIKTNASISGAECGCQAEIGSACSMAAAGLGELFGMTLEQIEYAAEVAMEHHLGLTCDPIGGLVQIPCIERNAVAAMRAISARSLAEFLTDTRKISFDMVVRTMYETGRDLFSKYRETGEGGLAKTYRQ